MHRHLLRVVLLAAPLVSACAAVLGIEDLPVANPALPGVDADVPETIARDACGDPALPFCARTCPAFAFCDDFEAERPGELLPRWRAANVLPKPFRSGIFAGTVEVVDSVDHGSILAIRVTASDDRPSIVGVAHAVEPFGGDAGPAPVVHLRAEFRIRSYEIVGGPEKYTHISAFGLGSLGFPFSTVSLKLLDPDSTGELVRVGLVQRTVSFEPSEEELGLVSGIRRADIVDKWMTLDLAAGSPTRLTAHGFRCAAAAGDGGVDAADGAPADAAPDASDAAADDPTYAFMRWGTIEICAPVVGNLQSSDWLRAPGLFGGAHASDFTTALFHFDDVAVRYLP